MSLDVLKSYGDALDNCAVFSDPRLCPCCRTSGGCPQMSANPKSWICGHLRTFPDKPAISTEIVGEIGSVQLVTYLSKNAWLVGHKKINAEKIFVAIFLKRCFLGNLRTFADTKAADPRLHRNFRTFADIVAWTSFRSINFPFQNIQEHSKQFPDARERSRNVRGLRIGPETMKIDSISLQLTYCHDL